MNQALPYLVCTLSGTLLGAFIAWLLTHVYARQALRQARRQGEAAERSTRALTTLLNDWESQGRVELARDEHGVITGGQIRLEGGTAAAQR